MLVPGESCCSSALRRAWGTLADIRLSGTSSLGAVKVILATASGGVPRAGVTRGLIRRPQRRAGLDTWRFKFDRFLAT